MMMMARRRRKKTDETVNKPSENSCQLKLPQEGATAPPATSANANEMQPQSQRVENAMAVPVDVGVEIGQRKDPPENAHTITANDDSASRQLKSPQEGATAPPAIRKDPPEIAHPQS